LAQRKPDINRAT